MTDGPELISKDEPKRLKGIAEISVDTLKLIERLQRIGVGEIITYETIADTIDGRDVRNGAQGNLRTALKVLQRDHRMVFECVRTVGYKRLSDVDVVSTTRAVLDRSRRSARRGFQRLTVVEFDGLPDEVKTQHQTYASALSMLHQVTKPSSIRKIEKRVQQSHETLSLAATLDAFKG